MFTLKVFVACQRAAMRPPAGFDRARTLVVVVLQTFVDWPVGVTTA